MSGWDEFEIANAAFELMTLEQRALVLKRFAELKYPSMFDRFFEAVHEVIREMSEP